VLAYSPLRLEDDIFRSMLLVFRVAYDENSSYGIVLTLDQAVAYIIKY
jgi:hypothetical protein